jgi:hypothetical protein
MFLRVTDPRSGVGVKVSQTGSNQFGAALGTKNEDEDEED